MSVDAYFLATADPATLLFTGSASEGIPAQAWPLFLTNEFLQADVNKFAQLGRSAGPANSLYAATAEQPEASPRYREILAPMGMGDELRAALVDGGSCWGFMRLHRETARAGFTAAERAFMAGLAPHLSHGLRTALLLEHVEPATAAPPADPGPGLLVLANDFSVAATTPLAEQWLSELDDWPRRQELPPAVAAVAARLLALERSGDARAELLPRARIRARSGRWLVLHAARLHGRAAEGQVAVIIEPAQPADVAPLLLGAYNLTAREAEVTQLVLQGLPTEAIAGQLYISPLTVQQHLKAVFEKVGVRSRGALVAQVFAQQYLPRMQAGERPATDGSFAPRGARPAGPAPRDPSGSPRGRS
jgi:DNA-binding CsgD family transcriptional regulator